MIDPDDLRELHRASDLLNFATVKARALAKRHGWCEVVEDAVDPVDRAAKILEQFVWKYEWPLNPTPTCTANS